MMNVMDCTQKTRTPHLRRKSGLYAIALLALTSTNKFRTAGSAAFVCAFSTTGNRFVLLQKPCCPDSASSVSTLKYAGVTKLHKRFSTAKGVAASVEEDIDSALDDILGEGSTETSGVNVAELQARSLAKPMPRVFVEEDDPINYSDPEFLSITNSYWIEAGLSPAVIDVLSEKGITKFTPVQAEAFAPVLAGRDVIGRSRTGTGKTLAFGLPSITRLTRLAQEQGVVDSNGRRQRGRLPSMVVLCPTRELARQVQEEVDSVARPLRLFSEVFHGGVSYDPQARALSQGIDIVVGTPGRIIDHINRGNLNLAECNIVVLDEADEMLNMGFADDVETILDGVGSANDEKTQCLLFSATTPPWVKKIGQRYQNDVLSIDSTSNQGGARTATTVRHIAIQVPPGLESKKAILEDIIAVEISKDAVSSLDDDDDDEFANNPIAAAAADRKKKSNSAMQQKIFGRTIVFTQTKRDADELVNGSVFKSLTAQVLHGDVGQKQRDATLAAFRAGAFNVLVATDVAGRGIDINDVDLVVQLEPSRETDIYVHRSGRTGRAGNKGISVLLFSPNQARDIVRIERDLGHGFKFELSGPPSTAAALAAAARTSAIACQGIPESTAEYFKDAAASLLSSGVAAEDIVAKCLAAISRRSGSAISRSLLTGEEGYATVEMTNTRGRPVSLGDVTFTVSKLARMSQRDAELKFDSDVGKIQCNAENGSAVFDMGDNAAKRLIEFSKDVEAGGATFKILKELELERGRNFGMFKGGGRGGGRYNRGGRGGDRLDRERSSSQSIYRREGSSSQGMYRREGNGYRVESSSSRYDSRRYGNGGGKNYEGGRTRRYEDKGGGRGGTGRNYEGNSDSGGRRKIDSRNEGW